jgi:hypothetical protein
MSRPTSEFALGDCEFRLVALPVLESTDLLPHVLEVLPYMQAAKVAGESDNPAGALSALRAIFGRMRPLVVAFSGSCTVRRSPDVPQYTPMSGALDVMFTRQHKTIFEWVMRCIEQEYGGFLSEGLGGPGGEVKSTESE